MGSIEGEPIKNHRCRAYKTLRRWHTMCIMVEMYLGRRYWMRQFRSTQPTR